MDSHQLSSVETTEAYLSANGIAFKVSSFYSSKIFRPFAMTLLQQMLKCWKK